MLLALLVLSSPFAFHSGFWNNLHHFLYVLGRAQDGTPDSQRPAVVRAPSDVEGLDKQPRKARSAWEKSVRFYAEGPSKKDTVFDKDFVALTQVLAAAPDDAKPSALGLPKDLVAVLEKAAPVYRAVWWARHRQADEARRDELQALVDRYGDAMVKRLTKIYGTGWPEEPRKIDLCAYANWAGAYSTNGGLIVVSATDEGTSGPLGLEILLHESSHQWDATIRDRISTIAAKEGKPVPPALSHALIFFTTGEIVAEAVPDHVAYGVKYGIWNKGGFATLHALLERYWSPYVQGKGTFDEAMSALLSHAALTH